MGALGDFPFGSARAMAAAVRAKEVSAVELLTAHLQRVDALNPALNAVVVDHREQAMEDARAADRALARGAAVGPLHGIPMTVKESFDLKGCMTTHGYPPMRENRAVDDALAVQRLKAAGAVIFGKTNVPLFLADFQSYNEIYGVTNNPWDHARGPGGSSGGGAAALAAGLTALEYGSDIGGSIRNPAAYCGVYGHKPTWPVVPKRGHTLAKTPVAEADLSVVGPLARTAKDLQLAFDVTAGPDTLTSSGVRYDFPAAPEKLTDFRVAVWVDEPQSPIDDEVRSAILAAAAALERAGAKVDYRARPDFDPAHAHMVYQKILWAVIGARRPDHESIRAEVAALSPGDQSPAAARRRGLVPSYKEVFDMGNQREQLRWAWRKFFDQYHVLLAPITATPAFEHDHSEPIAERMSTINGSRVPYFAQLFWAGLATCSLLPATAAPIGKSKGGLPIGLQVIGPEMGDHMTMRLAGELEQLIGGFSPPPNYRS